MRIVIAALAAVAIAGLAVSADATAAEKKKRPTAAAKDRAQTENRTRDRLPEFGFDAKPEHYRTGSNEWWRAMEREGRGGFGDTQ